MNNMEALEELNAIACRGELSFEVLCKYCLEAQTDIQCASNDVALGVARMFLSGDIDFEQGDQAMNLLFSIMTSQSYFKVTERAIPDTAMNVYLAFDSGEFLHPGDKPNDVPYLKHTRPKLQEILSSLSSTST
jgi:hypothetical protein